MLKQSADQIAAIRAIYNTLVAEAHVTPELLHAVKTALGDQISALDWTAHAVDWKHGKASDRSPYFPLQNHRDLFHRQFTRDFPTVSADIEAAFERHQPYQPGHEALAHIHGLSRINKHQQFTPQEKTDEPFNGMFIDGQLVYGMSQRRLQLGGRPDGQLVAVESSLRSPAGFVVVKARIIDWQFSNFGIPVLATLEALQRAIVETVSDIAQVADL